MADAKPTTKKAFIISAFTDAGTGESFEVGATPSISVGAFENYKAAGLARAATADNAKAKTAS